MESTAYFEKKISLTPQDFNKLKDVALEEILTTKSKDLMENKCSEHGFVLPGSVKVLSRSMGYFEAARFTGDAVYYVKLEGRVVYPADGVRVVGEVIRKNKMGLYVDYNKAIRVQVPRDLHLGNEEFDSVEIGDTVLVELKRSKFQINDPYILASGLFLATNPDAAQWVQGEEKEEVAEEEAEAAEEASEEEEKDEEEQDIEEEAEEAEAEEAEEEEAEEEEAEEEKTD
jgi:DNA repair exonuclease SbcCD nuclease subunit